MRLILLLLVTLLASAPVGAAVPTVSGTSTFVVADCTNAKITVRFISDAAPLALRTKDIRSKDHNNEPVAWSIAWDKPTSSDEAIHEYQATGSLQGGCPTAGGYNVPLTISLTGAASSEITITLVRAVDPVLDVPSSITLAFDTLPLGIKWANPELSVPLRETSHVTALKQLSASGSPLKTASGELTSIMLKPDFAPLDIAPGAGADLKLSLSQVPDPGTYSARLLLHSPALKQNQSIDVSLKVRVFWFFLLVAVGIGVALGWFVNVRLADRAVLDTAMLDGLRAAAAIARRATAQRDPAVQQRLITLAAGLDSTVRASTAPQQVQTAVTDAQAQVTQIETNANAAAAAFAQNLARVRNVMRPGNLPPVAAISDLLGSLTQSLDHFDQAGGAGNIEGAQRQLQAFEQTLPREIAMALQPWLGRVRSGLDQFGPWVNPAQEPERTRAALLQDVVTAYPLAEPAQLVQQSDAIARRLQAWLVLSAPSGMAEAFRAAAGVLRQHDRADLVEMLSVIIDDLMRGDAVGQDPIEKLKNLAQIRQRAEGVVRGAAPGNAAIDARLAQGDFPAAAAALFPERAGAVAITAAPAMSQPLTRPQTNLPDAQAPTILPRIILPPRLPVGQVTNVVLEWAGAPVFANAPQWTADPNDAAEVTDPTVNGAAVRPRRAGYLTIGVTFAGRPAITSITYAGDVTAAPDYTQIAAAAWWTNFWIGVATAIITTFAGYEIFIGAWVGTFADFFSAFLWGFFGQFGLNRIRELAKPIVSRALP